MAMPESVRLVIGGRVGRLGSDAGKVLAVASVIGRDFDLDLLARATTTSEDDVLDILDAAAAAALVRELNGVPGRYNFSHALIQRTLYEDLGATRRARAHRQAAEALEELCGDEPGARVGELARHWLAATQPIDLTKAIGYSRHAGDAALAALALRTRFAITRRPSTFTLVTSTPTRCLPSTWPSGSALPAPDGRATIPGDPSRCCPSGCRHGRHRAARRRRARQ